MPALASTDHQVQHLQQQIQTTELLLRNLKVQLQQAEQRAESARHLNGALQGGFPAEWMDETLAALQQNSTTDMALKVRQEGGFEGAPSASDGNVDVARRWPLDGFEYSRYGRQMIMPEIGLHGQLRLKNAKVLIVGVGGLGCPAAAYLAGAGVGTLGLVDGDTVEESNLHRQIAHSAARVGMKKTRSAVEYLQSYVVYRNLNLISTPPSNILGSLNPNINYTCYDHHLTPSTALPLVAQYDLVLDCTDHPTSRYLISDACVLAHKPLVSASALKTEGQLIVLNSPPRAPGDPAGGPCYRCVFPKPPPAETLLSCGEGGILGPVVGVMGVLQALEAIKVLTAPPPPQSPPPTRASHDTAPADAPKPTLLLFSAYTTPQFRSVRMRARRPACAACSPKATITRQSLTSGALDYVAFCGAAAPPPPLSPRTTISATAFAALPRDGTNILIDVRDETQYAICALRGSVNIPWTGSAEAWLERATMTGLAFGDGRRHFVMCRLGNDSRLAAGAVLEHEFAASVQNITGGFRAWQEEVDPSWPDY
ncbi:hypothetical protein LTR08_000632 [Meristemomyces frigidus]|nr:hypothetical protein LTR08_000632 [Meristemomyces frigidus]